VPKEGEAPPKYAWLGASGVATELSTGVATEDGASYVPQLARYLQTAIMVPPGAFPNGAGTGSPVTTEIPGWSVTLDQAESAATIAAYAAQQVMEREIAEIAAQIERERIARESTENQGAQEKLTEEIVEKEYYESQNENMSASIASIKLSFKALVDEVANAATAGGQWFYQHSIFNFEYEIKNRWGKGWLWELESEVFGPVVNRVLACYKGGKEASDEVSGPPDGFITEISVSTAAVVGCADGVLDG
jgi:hypothetical protein